MVGTVICPIGFAGCGNCNFTFYMSEASEVMDKASCHEKEDYEKEAMHRGATLCVDKLESSLLRAKLVEYASLQLTEGQHPSFL